MVPKNWGGPKGPSVGTVRVKGPLSQRVFGPKIYFTSLVLVPKGQDGAVSKQNMRNLNF